MLDLIATLRRVVSISEPKREFTIGVLVPIQSETSAAVTDKPDYVWCQELAQPQSIFQILNRHVPPVPGSMVKIGWPEKPPFERQVLGPYDLTAQYPGYLADDGGGSLNVPLHARSHEYPSEASPGTDPVTVYQPAIDLFKCSPSSGMVVYVRPGFFEWLGQSRYFAGQALDLTSFLPAVNQARNVLIYIDPSTIKVATISGTAATVPVPPPEPTLTVPGVFSAIVYVYNGQVSVGISDVSDRRSFANVANVPDNFDPGSPTEAGQILLSNSDGSYGWCKPLTNDYSELIINNNGEILC